MIPIGDDNSDRHLTPFVNYILIAANILVFIFLQGMGGDLAFTYAYSTVPAEILTGQDIVTQGSVVQDSSGQTYRIPGLQPTPIPVYLTIISSMFMHGDWMHLGGNMLYLWIFGDNLESRLGHARYLMFYVLCGIIASLCHVFITGSSSESSVLPSLGATGAISGIMGGYLFLFPKKKVHVFAGYAMVSIPAFVALGIWIVFQIISGAGVPGAGGGVAYAAHVGGFFAGLLLVKLFDRGPREIPKQFKY